MANRNKPNNKNKGKQKKPPDPDGKLELTFAEWYNESLSDRLNNPANENYKKSSSIKINFGTPDFEDKFCSHFVYNKKTNLFNFEEFISIPPKNDIKEIKKLATKIDKLVEQSELDKKNISKLEAIKTRKKNIEYRSKNIMKTEQIQFYPTENQKIVIKKWIKESEKCYNECTNLYNENKDDFNIDYKVIKLEIFKRLYGENNKLCPYDILTDEVRKFCSNLKSAMSNLKEGHIRNFEMKHLNKYRDRFNIFVPKSAIKNGTIYSTHLGKKINGLEKIIELPECDCRILYSKKYEQYWLCIPKITKRKIIETKREAVVGLDEGEVIFFAYHGENSFGEIGKGMRRIILEELGKIEKMQKILGKNKNKKGKAIKNKKRIMMKIQKRYNRIHNVVKELHNKAALFLCQNYERILLPEFKTQDMMRKRKYTKSYYKKLKEEKGEEVMREELRRTTKGKRLNKKVKKVLNMLSHYKFKQHLINKGNEYGCIVDTEVSEYGTTKTCTKCGCEQYSLEERIRECKNCKTKMDRDRSASRNVIIRNTKKEEIKKGCKAGGRRSHA